MMNNFRKLWLFFGPNGFASNVTASTLRVDASSLCLSLQFHYHLVSGFQVFADKLVSHINYLHLWLRLLARRFLAQHRTPPRANLT